MTEQPSEHYISEEAIRRRTGRGWDDWMSLLDGWGATGQTHAAIARWLSDEHAVDGWSAQAITVSYERARGMRATRERTSGFSAGTSKTIAAPVAEISRAVVDTDRRSEWLPDVVMRERTATPGRRARFDWSDGHSRVIFSFTDKGPGKASIHIEHERLADADAAERMRAFWRERLAALKQVLEA